MLDPAIKLGTSTPKAESVQRLRLAGVSKSGTFAAARRGSPHYRRQGAAAHRRAAIAGAAPSSSIYSPLLDERKADLSSRTHQRSAGRGTLEVPGAQLLPSRIRWQFGASYALAVVSLRASRPTQFALFVVSPQGQEILALRGSCPSRFLTQPAPPR